ncbi:MAG: 2,3-bisphosphoglycerate-independent phosphoglycerate mutase, partial [Defluviitaleaceae bacterium]|nr:2,3-bisphosphoglycerate-independent phosphoglycerate mutase [Defluviitaleaceae bacterium]
GRSPLEAAGMGLKLKKTDSVARCNMVTLSDEEPYEEKTMLDYSADEIPSDESAALINDLQKKLGGGGLHFYPGVSYRHCLVWSDGETGMHLTPPHDIMEKKIAGYLPRHELFLRLMKDSHEILKDHPINAKRIARGEKPANSLWIWGAGTAASLPPFKEKYGVKGTVIAAVDLLKGIAACAGMDAPAVPGATGNIHTNYKGKKDAAIEALRNGSDFAYLHIEAPDECGHRYEIENKVKAIELIDEKVVCPLLDELKQFGRFRILLLPDHPTPLSLRTHTDEPVPFVLYDSEKKIPSGAAGYDEEQAKNSGVFFEEGLTLIEKLLSGDLSFND